MGMGLTNCLGLIFDGVWRHSSIAELGSQVFEPRDGKVRQTARWQKALGQK